MIINLNDDYTPLNEFPMYEINQFGSIRNIKTKHPIAIRMDKNGRCVVQLPKDGKNHLRLVHRLVAEQYIPNPDNLPQVNHKDECTMNNCVANLEWISAKNNCNYGTRTERIIQKRKIKVTDKSGNIYDSIRTAAIAMGVSEAAIRKNINNVADGHYWSFVTNRYSGDKQQFEVVND